MTTCTCDYHRHVLKELLDQMRAMRLATIADLDNTQPLGQTGTRIRCITRKDTIKECMELVAARLKEEYARVEIQSLD